MPMKRFHSAGASGGLGPGNRAGEVGAKLGAEKIAPSVKKRTRRRAGRSGIPSRRAKRFLINSPPFEKVVADMITESCRLRDANRRSVSSSLADPRRSKNAAA